MMKFHVQTCCLGQVVSVRSCLAEVFILSAIAVGLCVCMAGDALAVSPITGDIDGDWDVDGYDLIGFASHWLDSGCSEPNWCGGADLNHDSFVGLADLSILARNWQKGMGGDIAPKQPNIFPTRLTTGPKGRIYVTDAKVDSVFIYDANIHPIGQIKGLSKPLGIAVDDHGRIFVGCDGSNSIEIFNSNGIRIGTIGRGLIRMPNDLTLDREGRLFVADSEVNTVWVFDSNGSVIRSIGSKGDAD